MKFFIILILAFFSANSAIAANGSYCEKLFSDDVSMPTIPVNALELYKKTRVDRKVVVLSSENAATETFMNQLVPNSTLKILDPHYEVVPVSSNQEFVNLMGLTIIYSSVIAISSAQEHPVAASIIIPLGMAALIMNSPVTMNWFSRNYPNAWKNPNVRRIFSQALYYSRYNDEAMFESIFQAAETSFQDPWVKTAVVVIDPKYRHKLRAYFLARRYRTP
jgi:hypothetical protein